MLQYWQARLRRPDRSRARTASQTEDADAIDPEMRVLAANALYRVAQRGPQDRPTLLKNLDAAIRAYDEALRAGVERPDVAFNYELAVRMRDEVGAGKRKALTNAKTDDTETDPNMHGDPGEPPKDMKVEQFQIRIPMDPKEIKQSQEQAAGPARRGGSADNEDEERQKRIEKAAVFERLIDFGSIRFGEPLYLWLLVAPAVLFVLWCWQVVRRRVDARKYRAARLVPVHERFAAVGDLGVLAGAHRRAVADHSRAPRPQGITAIVRSPGVDIVLLMDGSTSMRVRDMGTDRWQRAMQWVRTLTKTLSWNGDRMALATFADIAVPQVRLTRDPNTILFFLDHLDDAPTFRLENETSWNTNVEDAIYWGVKLVETDQEMYGRSKNARTFVVISDGQVWSGNVQRAITAAAQRGIAVDVIGVGTSNGGIIPLPRDDKGVVLAGFEPIRSIIDRDVASRDRARRQRRVFRDRHRGRRADRGAHHSERRAPLGQRAGRRSVRRAVLVSAGRRGGLRRRWACCS